MMLAAGPPAVALAGCLADGTSRGVMWSPGRRWPPAALEIACWSCLRVAAGTVGSTTRATSRRLTAPGATFVWVTTLPTPNFVSSFLFWEFEWAPEPPEPPPAYVGMLAAAPAAPPAPPAPPPW